MAEGGRNERASLGIHTKKHTKYGSTSQSSYTNETFLKHYVKPHETMQGIALKYSVTMEQLKRANGIWTNDSLFLREYLLIPLSKSPMQESKSILNGDSSSVSSGLDSLSEEIVTKNELRAEKMSRSDSKTGSLSSISENNVPEVNPKDFLSRFDSSLAQIRTNVKKLEDSSSFPEDETNPLSHLPSKRLSRYASRHKSRSLDVEDPTAEPDLMFRSHSFRSRKIRSSLEKLEKAQDEMFEL